MLFLTLGMILSLPGFSYAALDNMYANATNGSIKHHGGYFWATLQSMDPKWSTSSPKNFILHSMWLVYDSYGSWMELGYVKGGMDADKDGTYTNYDGFYTAKGVRNSSGGLSSYTEMPISHSSKTIGLSYTYRIERDPNNTSQWKTYIDGNYKNTWGSVSAEALRMDVGLETNNTSSESNRWNESGLSHIVSGQMKSWTTGTTNLVTKGLRNDLYVGWKTKYTSIYTDTNGGITPVFAQ